MGRPSLNSVIKTLQDKGFRAWRAYPGTTMPTIQSPAVSVAIHRDETLQRIFTVTIFCPEAMGGTECEDQACRITEALRSSGLACTQEDIRYDGRGDRFFVRILAAWTAPAPELPYSVLINGLRLPWVTAFSSEQRFSAEPVRQYGTTGAAALVTVPEQWSFTVEELIPAGTKEADAVPAPFSMLVMRSGKKENYQNCCWTGILRKDTREGLVQIRTGLATERSIV